ncbi:DNA repair protein-like protein Rad7, partial [Xylariaceae sp. FL0804]
MALFNERSAPLPGQMANCEVCDKRFTVTPYTRAGPNGGLLCNPCGKELAQEDDMSKNKPKKRKIAQGRRGVQSRLLDGISQTGAKSLMTLCTETLAKNIELADSLGTMPPGLIDRIARLLSKRRLLGPKTLPLFLQPDNDVFKVYDGAYLGSDHFINIFQTIPRLKSLKIRNAIQFKDHVLQYLTNRHITLESLSLHGANLLSESCWEEYLQAKGKHLRSLQVYYTDKHFGDGLVGKLSDYCPSLARLKICHNQAVSDEGLKSMVQLQSLEHLSLHLRKPTQTDSYIEIIQTIGSQLQTFSLRDVPDIDDRLLDALHEHCASLTKLRITGSEVLTDAGIARLFRGWKTKPLTFIDLQECRHVDSAKPRENPHHVGLCSQGFKALMEHSGKRLQYLNVYSCRNISQEAFEEVFSADQVYPDLEKIELSFCEEVTDYICGCIFRCCPNLKELQVHGCMKVKEVRVPRGKILVGVPNALGMLIEGD